MTKSKFEKKSEVLIFVVLSVIMLRIPVTHYACLFNGWYYSYIAEVIYVLSAVCLAAVIIRLLISFKKIKLSQYEFIFSVMLIFLGLSCYNAIDQHKALYGESGRNEGLFMLLCYYLLFYAGRLITSEKIRNLTVNTFILFMFCHAVYGITQHWAVKNSIVPVIDHYFYAISGVAGNPNFMGSLMVMATAVSMGMCIFSGSIFSKGIYGLLTGLFAFVLAYTKTMSGYVGAAVVMLTVFLLLLQNIYRKKGRKIAVSFVAFSVLLAVVVVIVIDTATYGIVSAEINNVINQLRGDINWETVASGRFLAWSNIFKMVPQYLLFGLGIDGLKQPYYKTFGPFLDSILDKAHNELIQILITMGLPVMILYILLYACVFKDLCTRIKAKTNLAVDMSLLLVMIGYLTQAMFNISVIDVAPYFWILLGLMAKPLIEK